MIEKVWFAVNQLWNPRLEVLAGEEDVFLIASLLVIVEMTKRQALMCAYPVVPASVSLLLSPSSTPSLPRFPHILPLYLTQFIILLRGLGHHQQFVNE
jgi:hypothetical protein